MWHVWEEQKCMQGLVAKPEGKRPLGRGRRGCENNIKMGDTEIGRDGMG